MPWFCTGAPKKKRSSKTRVSGVGKVRQDNNALSEGRPSFAVVLQSFASSIGDELTVQRGQVVEVMYHDGDWTFVRNLDAGSGYIPKMYCLSIDKVKGDFNNSMMNHITGPLPRPRVINVDTLQRSGSSVNSVEVHQVTSTTFLEASEPTDTSTRTSSSSQAIYEVPKSPAQRFYGSASQPTPEVMSEVTPSSTRAPSLPPRSANLPTPAEIQQQWAPTSSGPSHRPGFLPGCRQGNPFTVAMQGSSQGTPSTRQSPVLHRSASYRSTAGRSTALGQSPPSNLHHRSSQQTTPQAPPTPKSAPLPLTQSYPGHSTENSPSSAPSSARFSPGTQSSHNVGTSPTFNLGRRYSSQRGVAVGRGHLQMHGRYPQAEFSDNMAGTPGSAGVPSVAPSPISATRVAITPGAVTPGYAIKPARLAATPSGGTGGVDTTPQWTMGDADSTPLACNQRGHPRRFRRHSSDIVLLDSCISEDSNAITYHSPPQTVIRNSHSQRQRSQPCVAKLDIHSPPHRPTRLPVRRTLSMHDSHKHGVAAGGSNTPSNPIYRAKSYQEAVLGEEERRLGATASLKPSELLEARSCDNMEQSYDHKQQSRDHRRPNHTPESEPDDVFLPGVKKPFGIHRCTKGYQKTFNGEISLKKNELVIVLDQGRGEWAWAITSNNSEGLIPKSVLVRYHSDLGVGALMAGSGSLGRGRGKAKSDAETQTEQDTSVCPDSSGVSCNRVSCRENGASFNDIDASCNPTTPSCSNPHEEERADSGSAGIESGDTQSCPKEWFDTMDSIDAGKLVTRINSKTHPSQSEPTDDMPASHEEPSDVTPTSHEEPSNVMPTSHEEPSDVTPTSSDQPSAHSAHPASGAKASKIPLRPKAKKRMSSSVQQSEHSAGAVCRPKSTKSGPRSVPSPAVLPSPVQGGPAASRIPIRPKLRKAASVPQPETSASVAGSNKIRVKPGTVHYHDRISGIGSMNFENTTSIASPSSPSAAKRPSPLLTVIKDYTPSDTSKNCLPLKRGDILQLQPHMHYPKGWMWVWHIKRRSFGFVPKSYVAYTYNTPQRERRDTVEDAV